MKVSAKAVTYVPVESVPGFEPDRELSDVILATPVGKAVRIDKSECKYSRSVIGGIIGQIHKKSNAKVALQLVDQKDAFLIVVTKNTVAGAAKLVVKTGKKLGRPALASSKFRKITSLPLMCSKTIERAVKKTGSARIPKRLFRTTAARSSFVHMFNKLGYTVEGTRRSSKIIIVTGKRGGKSFVARAINRKAKTPVVPPSSTPATPALESQADLPPTENLTSAPVDTTPTQALQLA